MAAAPSPDVALVSTDGGADVARDYTRAAQTLIAIGLRLLDDERKEGDDEPDCGLRARVN